ncbi:MAG: TrmH family RNA methyltransferase [Actinomycetota bacterium]
MRNPRVLAARKLLRRSERARAGAFLVEGPIAVREVVAASAVRDLFVDENAPFAGEFLGQGGLAVTRQVVSALADTSTPQGVVAVAEARAIEAGAIGGDLVVVLADVRDPGNAGTLLRSAVAAGSSGVVFAKGSVDPFNPKTVRATAGLLFRVPVAHEVALEEALSLLTERGFLVVGADAGSGVAPEDVDLTRPVAFVLGNESWGIGARARPLLNEVIGIPMPGSAESLNVGIAGSILMFEAVRQRRLRF